MSVEKGVVPLLGREVGSTHRISTAVHGLREVLDFCAPWDCPAQEQGLDLLGKKSYTDEKNK